MLPIYKHPSTREIVIADFADRLALGETLIAVVDQPTIAARNPVDATDINIGPAIVNPDLVQVAHGEAPVQAEQGAQFSVAGGQNGASYWVRITVSTTVPARQISKDLPVIVGEQY